MTRPAVLRIGIYGGSFNPPHVCHQLVSLMALECAPIDVLWWVPTYRHALGKELAPFSDRIAMCGLAVAGLGARVEVRDDEAALFGAGQPSRTLALLEHVLATYPGVTLRLIMGADILAETASWHRWEEVVRLAPPWVVPRAGYPSQGVSGVYEVAPAELPNLASSALREQLRATGRAPGLPRAVADYIVTHGLYR